MIAVIDFNIPTLAPMIQTMLESIERAARTCLGDGAPQSAAVNESGYTGSVTYLHCTATAGQFRGFKFEARVTLEQGDDRRERVLTCVVNDGLPVGMMRPGVHTPNIAPSIHEILTAGPGELGEMYAV